MNTTQRVQPILRLAIIATCWLWFANPIFAKNSKATTTNNSIDTFLRSERFSIALDNKVFSNITITTTVTDATCNDNADGSIDIEPTGGVPPFTYAWSNGMTTQDIYLLPAGSYELTISDANNCNETFTITVNAPPLLIAEVLGATDLSCNEDNSGSIPLTVTGGTPPYNFDWDFAPDVQNPTGLAAGDYNVFVTDFNGCTALASATLTEPTQLVLDEDSSAPCSTTAGGEIDLSVSGGTTPYDYDWTNGSTTEDVDNLMEGTYDVIVTDANGCTESLSITVDAPEPVELNLSDLSDFIDGNVSCNNASDGFATVQASGGIAPFTYAWSNGDSLATAQDLAAGTYSVTTTDANGCTDETMLNLEEPDPIFVATMARDVICYGDANGAILVDSIDGGATPFMYALDGGDLRQEDWFTSLSAGSYEVLVQDANGCEALFTQIVESPPALQIFIDGDSIIRLGEQINISADLSLVDTSSLRESGWASSDFWVPNTDGTFCDSCLTRSIRPLETTTYAYSVIDEDGCIGREELRVQVLKDRAVFIPNAFSPNGDGKNDVLSIYPGPEVANIDFFKVYNKWGAEVYQHNNFTEMAAGEGWDGYFKSEVMDTGVYVYQAQVEFWDGRVEVLKGDVTLVR